MAGCNKKKRARKVGMEITTDKHKETRQARHKKYGHSYTRSSKTSASFPKDATPHDVKTGKIKARTFEDEYKSYRKTRGRKGWSFNPDKRKESAVYLSRNSVFNVQRVPMTELMERAILAHEEGRVL